MYKMILFGLQDDTATPAETTETPATTEAKTEGTGATGQPNSFLESID